MSVVGFSRQSCRNVEKENNYKSCDTCQDRFLCWTDSVGDLETAASLMAEAAGNTGITMSQVARIVEEHVRRVNER